MLAALLPAGEPAAKDVRPVDAVRCEKEIDCLAGLKGLVSRKGDALRLALENGKTKVIKGNREACADSDAEKCLVFDLRAYLPSLDVYVIGVGLWEDDGALVVSTRTGKELYLEALPEFSPSGRWFVSVSNSEMGDRTYDVGIWSTNPDKPKQEFRYDYRDPPYSPDEYRYEHWEFVAWDGDDRIKLKVTFNYADCLAREFETDAVLTGDGWRLNHPRPNCGVQLLTTK